MLATSLAVHTHEAFLVLDTSGVLQMHFRKQHEATLVRVASNTVMMLILAGGAIAAPHVAQGQTERGPIQLALGRAVRIPANAGDAGAGVSAVHATAIAPDGTILIADNSSHRLHAYDRAGRQFAELSLNRGARDGQPIFATSIDVEHLSEIVLYDMSAREVSIVALSDGKLSLQRSFSVDVPAREMCVAGEHIFFLALVTGSMVHGYTMTGHRETSFGAPWPGPTSLQQMLISSSGRLVCASKSGLVIVAVGMTPLVRAFRTNGTERWSYTIPGFRMPPTKTYPDGSVEFTTAAGQTDLTLALFTLDDKYVALQVARGGHRDVANGRNWLRETIFLGLEDGQRHGGQLTLPDIKRARGRLLLTIEKDSTPSVLVYPFHFTGLTQ